MKPGQDLFHYHCTLAESPGDYNDSFPLVMFFCCYGTSILGSSTIYNQYELRAGVGRSLPCRSECLSTPLEPNALCPMRATVTPY